jgi:hypothetical protein
MFDDLNDDGGYLAPNQDCTAHLVATFGWPNGESCIAEAWIEVIF